MLKVAREEKGLTLAEVEEMTHIRQHLIEALEQNNTKLFPSPVIARGMIRNYAKFLKLDPIEALKLYDGNGVVPVKGQRLTPQGIEFMNLSMAPRPLVNWEFVFGILIGFVVIGTACYLAYGTVLQPMSIIATPTKTPRATGTGLLKTRLYFSPQRHRRRPIPLRPFLPPLRLRLLFIPEYT
jgi:cytoskeletal protein RodZ